ncbi:MAG: rimI [Capsulimonas sp.]|nr:rimI [Capsulimonas sp.]
MNDHRLYEQDAPTGFGPITIRHMVLEDIEEVARLERRSNALPWSLNAYATEIGNTVAHYLIARDRDGTLVGYGGMWIVMDEAHFTNIAVDPSARRRKIGERLLLSLLQYGVEHGTLRATLEVRERNKVAHNLYLKHGFEDVSVRKNYYSDNQENAVIMWLENMASPEYCEHMRRGMEIADAWDAANTP